MFLTKKNALTHLENVFKIFSYQIALLGKLSCYGNYRPILFE